MEVGGVQRIGVRPQRVADRFGERAFVLDRFELVDVGLDRLHTAPLDPGGVRVSLVIIRYSGVVAGGGVCIDDAGHQLGLALLGGVVDD